MHLCRFKNHFKRLLYIYKTFFFSPPAMLAAKRQDGGLFKSPPYPGYPFIMIPDLTSPYLPNGSLSPTARTVSSFISPTVMCTRTLVFRNKHTRAHTLLAAHTECCQPRSAAEKRGAKFCNSWGVQWCCVHVHPLLLASCVCSGLQLAC